MKLNNLIKIISYSFGILFFPTSTVNAAVVGNATLKLQGVIDLTESARVMREVQGSLSGLTTLNVTPIYDNSSKTRWNESTPLVGLSSNQTQCDSNNFVNVPYFSYVYGIPLVNSVNGEESGFVVPRLNYEILISDFGNRLEPSYQGTFYTPENSKKLSPITITKMTNACFTPSDVYNTVPAKGRKVLNLFVNKPQILYVDNSLPSGKLKYNNSTPYYFFTSSFSTEGRSAIKLNIEADLTILRYCEVSNVTNSQIKHTFVDDMQSLHQSSLTITCNGTTQDTIRVVATAKEADFDTANPKKLLLRPSDSSIRTNELPWVIGTIYEAGKSLNISCNDSNNAKLIRFNGEEVDLGIKNTQKTMLLGISWALCRTPNVKGGDYHGKADLEFFIKS
ncbi:hypothetical protein C9446_05600 [Providencia heimbachae]|uniref:hypothetical protein n=1 Tax=Providencia heimbachae TaxID=333962 RepID=UPI0010BF42F3|nr:hypothetical protein [Providencia heimbachae]QCJ69384.1 hypothetical protein C9446_05600 [Providencia heimbachae]